MNILNGKFFRTLSKPTLAQNRFFVQQKTNFMKKINWKKNHFPQKSFQSKWKRLNLTGIIYESRKRSKQNVEKQVNSCEKETFPFRTFFSAYNHFQHPICAPKMSILMRKMCGSVLRCVCVEQLCNQLVGHDRCCQMRDERQRAIY